MKRYIKSIVYDVVYMFLNYFVNNIPIWCIRRLFYKMFGMKIGKRSRIHMKTVVINPWKIAIGDRTIINEFCFIDGRGGLNIGSDVSISVYSSILTASHYTNSAEFAYKKSKVVIGNNVWVGIRAIILEGTEVKNGAIIGAGAVIKKYAEENGIYTGNPSNKIGNRTLDNKYNIDNVTFFR